MLSKFLLPGNKIELQEIGLLRNKKNDAEKKIYYSRVYDILDEDRLEITMPMEKTKLQLLQVDEEYEMVVYGVGNVYQCIVRVTDRYKSNNVYLLSVELTSNLKRIQRREFYRYSCALEMQVRNLEPQEVSKIEEKGEYELVEERPLKRGVIVDISGGGLRFICEEFFEMNSLVCCKYQLVLSGEVKEFQLVGRILVAKNLENKQKVYEYRIQYMNIDLEAREDIIKYIFQEERKSRKRESGL